MTDNQPLQYPWYVKALRLQSLFTSQRYPFFILLLSIFYTGLYVFVTSFAFQAWFQNHVVNANLLGVYPYFLSLSLLLLAFSLVLTYRSIKYEHSSMLLLNLSLYLGAISYFFGFLNWDVTVKDHTKTSYYQLQVLLSTISILLLYLHYELNSKDHPNSLMLGVISFLFAPLSILNVYYLVTGNYARSLQEFEWWSVALLQVGAILIFLQITTNGVQTSKILFKHGDKARILGGLQLAGLYLLLLSVLLELGETILPFSFYNTPLYITALLLISIPYIIDPNIIIFIPLNVYLYGIVDEVGLTHYYRPLADEYKSKDEFQTSQLFGGLAIAFKNFGEEIVKTKQGMDSLNFGDRSIIVEYVKPYYLILVANRSTYFLQREMQEYLQELKQAYPEPPETGMQIPKTVFQDLDKKFFPIVAQSA